MSTIKRFKDFFLNKNRFSMITIYITNHLKRYLKKDIFESRPYDNTY